MFDLLDSLTSENLVIICLVLGVIALCLAIGISVEIYTTNKKYAEENKDLNENTQTKLNIKESENVIYVEEDSELEKTKAKMEL
jgi:ATP/ADP translocase